MRKFVYEILNQRKKNECICFSMHDEELGFNGPGIEYDINKRLTRMGLMNEKGDFVFELQLANCDGTKYLIRVANSEGIYYGPMLLFENKTLSFAESYKNFGVDGNVYHLKKNEQISVDKYEAGICTDRKVLNQKITSDVAPNLPIKLDYCNGLIERSFKIKNKKINEYICDNGNKHTIAAQVDQAGNVLMGTYKDNGFDGIVMRVIKKSSTIYLNNFNNGVEDDKWRIIYSPRANGFAIVTKKKNGNYNRYIYCDQNREMIFSMSELGKDGKEVEPVTFFPSSFEKLDSLKEKKENKKVNAKLALDNLVGLDNVKLQIKRLKAYFHKVKNDSNKINLNFVFSGNPGTGKTEVARLLASILYDEGIIKENKLVEVDRSNLVAEFIGQTESKVKEVIEQANGGVLFIDEAYSLYSASDDSRDFGKKAVDILIKAIEDKRGDFAIIFAGYKEPMDKLVHMNPGFRSRIKRFIDFPDFSLDELRKIAKLMLDESKYKCDDKTFEYLSNVIASLMKKSDFANAREIRNMLEDLYEIQAVRTYDNISDRTITIDDINEYILENKIEIKEKKKSNILINKIQINKNGLKKDKINNESLKQASVSIKVKDDTNNDSEGTGFLISSDGIVATCAHVVSKANEINVDVNFKIEDGNFIVKTYPAQLLSYDSKADVALLKISNLETDLTHFSIDEKHPKILDNVVMAGYPFGKSRFKDISITEGKIQSINTDDIYFENDDIKKLYVDISGNPGDSGAAVINSSTGKVIGIFAGCAVGYKNNVATTINYAIPCSNLVSLIEKVNTMY